MRGLMQWTIGSLLLLSNLAFSQEIDMSKCKPEVDATNAALGMRDHGKTKAELEATLPPRDLIKNDQRAVLLHAILDDIYSRPDVASFPYFHYRALVCLTRSQGFNVSVPFDKVADALVTCQEAHGPEESEPLGNCISEAVGEHM